MPAIVSLRRRLGCWTAAIVVSATAAGCGADASTETSIASVAAAASLASQAATTTAAASTTATATSPAATHEAPPLVGPAIADEEADREIAAEVGASCDLPVIEALAARHPGVRQFVTVATDSWSATTAQLEIAAFDGVRWVCQLGPRTAMVGAQGTRPLLERRSGDDTTPAGVFPLGTQTAWDGQRFQFFGNSPDPGVRGTYRAVRPEDCWGATPGASTYQQLYRRQGCPGPDDEWLQRFGDVYSSAAVIGANLAPVSGDAPGEAPYAAAIFLHRHNYSGGSTPRPTSGCVSLAAADLATALPLIDPALDAHFAIGLRDWLIATA